jgi:squalene-hopene/tetraprenyl-beta-curcumene cyclase
MTPRSCRFSRVFLTGALVVLGGLCGSTRAAGQEAAPTANSPEEPKAEKYSAQRAAAFLDQTALKWTEQRKCGSCHTNYLFLVARPSLKAEPGTAEQQVRGFFEDRAAHWDKNKPRWDTEVVATAATLAMHDARTTGKLHPITRQALDKMWTLQRQDGAWDWLKCNWPPMEHDDYFGAAMAALGLGMAPDGYATTPAAREGLSKLRKFFAGTPAPDLHHRAMLLWASQHLDGLMTKKEQQDTVEQLLALERPDGGWNLASLGDYQRQQPTRRSYNDKNGPSDGYGTGFVLFVLRQAGVPSKHEKIQRGVLWLKQNQRVSGRWFTRSLSTDNYHFITHAGTAYAVMALAACGEQ